MHRMHSKAATDGLLIVIVGWREEEVLSDLNKDQYAIMPQTHKSRGQPFLINIREQSYLKRKLTFPL